VSRLAGFLTGGEGISRDPLVESAKGVVLTYAVASYAWTFTIAYNILLAIGGMLQPYGLDRLAQSVAGLVLLVGIVAPPLMVGMHIKNLFKQGGSDQLRSRVLRRGTLAALTAAVDGYVRQVAVDDAQQVSSGEILAVMENPLLVTQLASLQAELGAAQAQLDAASAEGSTANLSSLRGVCAQLRSALDKMREDEKSLQLRAPSAGKVIGRDLPMLKGRLLRRGELFCEIVPDGPLVVVVALDERSAGKVGPGQKADFRLRSLPGIEFSGKVISVESTPSRTFPHEALGAHAGGTVPSSAAGQAPGGGLQTLPTGAVYEAKVAIDNPDGILRPGMSGRLRIEGGKKPLGAILWDSITSMIRTDFRL
jgi:multidrug efflux pump subunit AcrA (membrane-fusion protein)